MQKNEELGNKSLANEDRNRAKKYSTPLRQLTEMFEETAVQLGFSPNGQRIDMNEFPDETRQTLKGLYFKTGWQGMNIFAMEGDEVIFIGTQEAGSDEDKAAVRDLKEGAIYKVDNTFVSDCMSYVLLKEFPAKLFNTIYFKNSLN